jgi:hypothetical protein
MKITTVLLVVLTSLIGANNIYSQSVKISLNLKNVTVEQVLNEIENKSDFYFLFNQKLVDVNRKVDIVAENLTIHDICQSGCRLLYGRPTDNTGSQRKS